MRECTSQKCIEVDPRVGAPPDIAPPSPSANKILWTEISHYFNTGSHRYSLTDDSRHPAKTLVIQMCHWVLIISDTEPCWKAWLLVMRVGISACKGNIGQRLMLAQKKNCPPHYGTPFATVLADTVSGTGVVSFTGYTFKQALSRNTSIVEQVCVTAHTLQVSSRFLQCSDDVCRI